MKGTPFIYSPSSLPSSPLLSEDGGGLGVDSMVFTVSQQGCVVSEAVLFFVEIGRGLFLAGILTFPGLMRWGRRNRESLVCSTRFQPSLGLQCVPAHQEVER